MSDVNSWETICEATDIPAGLGVRALLGEAEVAVFRVAEKLYAVDAIDPFTKMPVLARGLVGDLQGQVVVASPIYKQHFNLETGQCLEDEAVKLNVYPVREEAGQVQLAQA
ncbi:nitrite reductase small subunit NirD [Agaribacterium sp. ZY112]|uniref:nitrite reductase small subunit NirD n=1 Tax=Agaribacterium sp. ZY112 TaxID=3233574 RepID=UPI00352471FF